eukprot:7595684-Alexandrium_andersonii.AAC.1
MVPRQVIRWLKVACLAAAFVGLFGPVLVADIAAHIADATCMSPGRARHFTVACVSSVAALELAWLGLLAARVS